MTAQRNETANAIVERICAALDGVCPSDKLTALATVLVWEAVTFRRLDGTIGTTAEVKDFLNGLTAGLVDIQKEAADAITNEIEDKRHNP